MRSAARPWTRFGQWSSAAPPRVLRDGERRSRSAIRVERYGGNCTGSITTGSAALNGARDSNSASRDCSSATRQAVNRSFDTTKSVTLGRGNLRVTA